MNQGSNNQSVSGTNMLLVALLLVAFAGVGVFSWGSYKDDLTGCERLHPFAALTGGDAIADCAFNKMAAAQGSPLPYPGVRYK